MSRSALIAILPGDGIGPEVTQQAVRVLREVAAQAGHQLTFEQGLIGGAAIDAEGSSMPQQTVSLCSQADAILLDRKSVV